MKAACAFMPCTPMFRTCPDRRRRLEPCDLLHLPSATAGVRERDFAHPWISRDGLKIIGIQCWGCDGYSLVRSISPTTRQCAA